MHVGKGINFQNLSGELADGEIVAFELGLADEAESLGFESIWTPEHHFSSYHMCPSVLQVLTYLAGRTTSVGLGSMVVVLPWHEPVRVAEELSMLDHMSGGRLILGLGRGLGRVEFDGLRLPMSESRQRFMEYGAAIVKAFDTGILTSDGQYYRQPPVPIRPAPARSLRGRVYASAMSPDSMEVMAGLGFGVMVIAQKPWEAAEAEIAHYRDRFTELNGFPPPKPVLVSFVAVHESEQAAQEMYERHLMAYCRSAVDHYEFANANLAQVPGYEYYGRIGDRIAKHGTEGYARFLADLQIHGTPDQVTEQLTENVRRLDGGGVIAVLSYGDMAFDAARENQRLFARSVLPRLQAIDTDRRIGVTEPVSAGR